MAIAPTHQWLCPGGDDAAAKAYTTALGLDPTVEWQMQPGEQSALVALLAGLRPKVAIEIGSRYGGSMQVLHRFADRVISLDIDPTCRERLGPKFPKSEFITGDSKSTLPPLMKQLEQEHAAVGFILVDGDHSAAGVQGDIRGLLHYRPSCPLFVILHDSFNPHVREGIRTAPWSENPYVHAVELDYVPGVPVLDVDAYREMWGGFALAILLPEARPGTLETTARMDHLFRTVYRRSAHWPLDPPTLTKRVIRKCRKVVGLG
jgi:cephalosporin hydroxylase